MTEAHSADLARLEAAKLEIDELVKNKADIIDKVFKSLDANKLAAKNMVEIGNMQMAHSAEIEKLKARHLAEIEKTKAVQMADTDRLKAEHLAETNRLKAIQIAKINRFAELANAIDSVKPTTQI